jgi:ankyrin repeat protein
MLQLAKYMVEKCGANVLAMNNDGKTPLQIACDKGHKEMVVYFIGLLPAV